jgi:RNA polymerase sigma-70 factor (ECF subfamily)
MRRPWESAPAWHARLARRASRGDRAAFVELYRALHPAVSRFVARRVPVRADAEDVVSRTFHRFLERLGQLDPARGSPLGYALALARSAVGDHLRASAARPGPFADGAGPDLAHAGLDAHAALEREETLRAVAALVEELPAATRELLALRFGDGLRHADIAAITGASEAAVKQRLSRALRELRAALRAPAPGTEEVTP